MWFDRLQEIVLPLNLSRSPNPKIYTNEIFTDPSLFSLSAVLLLILIEYWMLIWNFYYKIDIDIGLPVYIRQAHPSFPHLFMVYCS